MAMNGQPNVGYPKTVRREPIAMPVEHAPSPSEGETGPDEPRISHEPTDPGPIEIDIVMKNPSWGSQRRPKLDLDHLGGDDI